MKERKKQLWRAHEVGPTESLILLQSLMILSQSASPTPPVADTSSREREGQREREGERGTRREKGRERERDKEREREREREGQGEREGERERGTRRERGRERERDKERERDRGRKRVWGRERGGREREREREGGRERGGERPGRKGTGGNEGIEKEREHDDNVKSSVAGIASSVVLRRIHNTNPRPNRNSSSSRSAVNSVCGSIPNASQSLGPSSTPQQATCTC